LRANLVRNVVFEHPRRAEDVDRESRRMIFICKIIYHHAKMVALGWRLN
jgi:hypothetical protein